MMAVGNVQRGNSSRRLNQPVATAAVHAPDRVTHTVTRLEIDERLGPGGLRNDLIDVCASAIDQKHRPGLGLEREHMPRTIVFLVAPRPFVLLDDAAIVLV